LRLEGVAMPRVAVLAAASHSGEAGGAERFYAGLRDALQGQGAAAEIVPVINDESNFEAIEETYLRYYDLDLSAYDGVISTKAPGYVVRHPNHVCYLQHTMRVFYDMFDAEFPRANAALHAQRRLIHQLDTAALRSPRTRARFVISHEVRDRMLRYNGLDSEVLYQASTLAGLRAGRYEYVFLPGRLHRWKRVQLAVAAFGHVRAPVRLLISGTGEDEAELRRSAAGDSRIQFLGRVSDAELTALYADALVVPFLPVREDFGLVTLEAFLSRKPVITCRDSGEPARLVRDGVTGFVCAPKPREIAGRIDALAADPALAKRMGEAGAESVRDVRWDNVATTLLAALRKPVSG
jgi:glycosyltransferase involved in cell wall biosynthesis